MIGDDDTCVLRAHGHEPVWMTHGKLAAESRAALGHKSISTTDTYLNVGRLKLQESMERFEAARGKLVGVNPAGG